MAELRRYRNTLDRDLKWRGPITARACSLPAHGVAYLDPIDTGRHLEDGIIEEVPRTNDGGSRMYGTTSFVTMRTFENISGEDLDWTSPVSGLRRTLPRGRGGLFAPGDVAELVKKGLVREVIETRPVTLPSGRTRYWEG